MQDSFQKTRTFFGVSGSRNIRKQIILYAQLIHHQKKRFGSISLLPVFAHSDYLLFFPCPSGRIAKAGSDEESSSLIEKRGGNRMEMRLTEKRVGRGLRWKEKTLIRNGGVEEAGSFKKNGPILYFSRNDYLRIDFSPPPWHPKEASMLFLGDGSIRFFKDTFRSTTILPFFRQPHLVPP